MSTAKLPKNATGRGWVAAWRNGDLGWWLPEHIRRSRESLFSVPARACTFLGADDPVYLCEITVKLVLDKNGRPIVRYPAKGKKP